MKVKVTFSFLVNFAKLVETATLSFPLWWFLKEGWKTCIQIKHQYPFPMTPPGMHAACKLINSSNFKSFPKFMTVDTAPELEILYPFCPRGIGRNMWHDQGEWIICQQYSILIFKFKSPVHLKCYNLIRAPAKLNSCLWRYEHFMHFKNTASKLVRFPWQDSSNLQGTPLS